MKWYLKKLNFQAKVHSITWRLSFQCGTSLDIQHWTTESNQRWMDAFSSWTSGVEGLGSHVSHPITLSSLTFGTLHIVIGPFTKSMFFTFSLLWSSWKEWNERYLETANYKQHFFQYKERSVESNHCITLTSVKPLTL